MKRKIKIGQHIIPLWLILAVLLSSIVTIVAGGYIWGTITVPMKVNEPLRIRSYPRRFTLFPGEVIEFNVTVENLAPVNYTVILDFSLDNATYQDDYARFSNVTYIVESGLQDLEAWLKIESHAPPLEASLTIDFMRIEETPQPPPPPPPPPPYEQLVFITVTFSGTSGDAANTIVAMVRNIGPADITIIMYKLGYGGTAHDIPDVIVAPGEYATVTLPTGANGEAWTSGTTYDVYLITSYGNHFYYRVTVDGGVEWLEIIDATFSGTSGDVANIVVLSVQNVGTKDVTVDSYKLGYHGTVYSITPVAIAQGSTASVTCTTGANGEAWLSGTTYEIYLYTTTGKKFSYAKTAP